MRMVLAYIGVGLASERPDDPGLDSNAIAWWFSTDTGEISFFKQTWHIFRQLTPE